jgi:hypothetical protein
MLQPKVAAEWPIRAIRGRKTTLDMPAGFRGGRPG